MRERRGPRTRPRPPGSRTLAAESGAAAHPARWWTPLPDSRVACGLCFRGCRIAEGERGHCGVRENRGGALKTLVHSRPCALALDPIEKKPFFHVLPGASALSLGTAGCNFDCRWLPELGDLAGAARGGARHRR